MVDFEYQENYLEELGYNSFIQKHENFSIPNAKEELERGLKYFCGDSYYWFESYSKIVDYLSDNHGKGLLLNGTFGTGKTLIAARIIPLLLHHYLNVLLQPMTSNEMNIKSEKLLESGHWYMIDDIGTEGERVVYGERKLVFPLLMDKVARQGDVLFLTSNLNTEEIGQRYGQRTFERLIEMCRVITITGESKRPH